MRATSAFDSGGITASTMATIGRGRAMARAGRPASQGMSLRAPRAMIRVAATAITVMTTARAEANWASRFSSTSCQTTMPVVQASLPPSMRAET